MVPMSSTDANLSEDQKQLLLDLARDSIYEGLAGGRLMPQVQEYPPALQEHGASFVTLNIHERLRGCIGTLEAYQPLVLDVVEHAYAAAFRDPRFPRLTQQEYELVDVHISLLGKPQEIHYSSEADLIGQLRPGTDGLILEEGSYRGTFLPSVWESLQNPEDFLRQLKRKAGLPMNYWSETIIIKRYTTESIS